MSIVTITPSALQQMRNLIKQRNKTTLGIKIGVKTGGCSGYKYYIEYADVKDKYDEMICIEELVILIEPRAIMYLMGSQMDYITEQFKTGFVFKNPNEKSSCGCKKSFSV